MATSPSTQLGDLPDALLSAVYSCNDYSTQHRLLSVSRRFRDLFHLPLCLRRLCGPYLDFPSYARDTAASVNQLVVLAKRDPGVQSHVRQTVRFQHVVRIVDQIVKQGTLASVYSDFVRLFQLEQFREAAPGIYLEIRLFGGGHSNLNVRGFFNMFNVPLIAHHIDIQVHETIANSIRVFIDETAGRSRTLPRRQITKSRWGSVFSSDVMNLGSQGAAFGSHFPSWLLKHIPDSDKHLLKDPAVLFSLVRIGVRFSADEYLQAIPISSADFDDLAPFFVYRSCSLETETIRDMVRNGNGHILLRILTTYAESDKIKIFDDLLRLREYELFHDVRLFYDDSIYEVRMVKAAICHNAPRDIVDLLIDKCSSDELRWLDVFLCQDPELRHHIGRKLSRRRGESDSEYTDEDTHDESTDEDIPPKKRHRSRR